MTPRVLRMPPYAFTDLQHDTPDLRALGEQNSASQTPGTRTPKVTPHPRDDAIVARVMAVACSQCNGITVWDDSAASAVCTSCGTLADPSQSVFTSQYDFYHEQTSWDFSPRKRCRSSSSWALIDQGKEARDSRNTAMTLEFVESLARSLNASGLSPRTMTLFHQARHAMQIRWGRRAKQVAGTCLAIALRESNRPDCLHDIAQLLDESFIILSRTLLSITTTLGLSLGPVDSGSHVPTLQQHLCSLLQDTSSPVSPTLRHELSSISLHDAAKTATSLCNLLARVGSLTLTQHSTPPVACAIFILALESELRSTIKQLGPLAEILSTRLHVGKSAVMTLYKIVQDAVAPLADDIPWLDKYRLQNNRAAVAKRNVVARAVKDIVTFYDDTWNRIQKPAFNIICEDSLPDSDANSEGETVRPRKKVKTGHRTQRAMQFLLDPITGPTPQTPRPHPPETASSSGSASQRPNHNFLSYFLSAHAAVTKPTRLQILVASRGSAEDIPDEELFDEGELEGLMRSEEEIKIMAHLQDWEGIEKDMNLRVNHNKHKTTASESGRQVGGRIDLDALAKLLNDDGSDDQPFIGLLGTEYDESSADESEIFDDETRKNSASSDEIVIQCWRPPSPGNNPTNDRYDQVYD